MKILSYNTIRSLHLYASLPIVALILMYIFSSYFMIHYQFFGTYERAEQVREVIVDPAEVTEHNWPLFLAKQGISGRLTHESTNSKGEMTRGYSRAGQEYLVTLVASGNRVQIKTTRAGLPGFIVGLHRIRGYGGGWKYDFYALMLDLVGVSLILFAITGAILWLKLLKHDLIAWLVFAAGFLYVASIITYLMME